MNNATRAKQPFENTFRATNIALIDEWSQYVEKLNIDLFEIIKAIKIRPTHSNILNPGLGVGGYCLTKDPYLAKFLQKRFLNLKKIASNFQKTILTNKKMPLRSVNKILKFKRKIKSKNFIIRSNL